MLDYKLLNRCMNKFSNKEQGNIEIPEFHQKLVMERFENARKNPENLVDWEEAKKILNVK